MNYIVLLGEDINILTELQNRLSGVYPSLTTAIAADVSHVLQLLKHKRPQMIILYTNGKQHDRFAGYIKQLRATDKADDITIVAGTNLESILHFTIGGR